MKLHVIKTSDLQNFIIEKHREILDDMGSFEKNNAILSRKMEILNSKIELLNEFTKFIGENDGSFVFDNEFFENECK
jgi:uncharacterized protein (DUF924 family)